MTNLISLLEKYQATTHVVGMNLHNIHWNLEDKLFFTLHPYFGDLYEQISGLEDEIAEQIRFLKSRPVTTLGDIDNLSSVQDLSSDSINSDRAIAIALADIESLYEVAKSVVKEADAANIWAAVEKFSGHLVLMEKIIYFLRSSKI